MEVEAEKIDPDLEWRNTLGIELAHPRGAYQDVLPERCWGWSAQKKEDGNRESLQFGRTRNWLVGRNRKDKLKGVDKAGGFMVHDDVTWVNELVVPDLAGTLLDGELEWPGHGAAEISTAKAKGKTAELQYVVFDCLFYKGTDLRRFLLRERLKFVQKVVDELKNSRIAPCQTFVTVTKERVAELFKAGWEGVVFKDLESRYDDPAPKCWFKCKSESNVDVFITGVTEGKSNGSPKAGIKPKPNGKVATFEVSLFDKGKIRKVGMMTNLPEKVQNEGLLGFSQYEFKVAEATVSGFDGRAFRWVRFKRFRDDKTPRDCEYSSQVGGATESGV